MQPSKSSKNLIFFCRYLQHCLIRINLAKCNFVKINEIIIPKIKSGFRIKELKSTCFDYICSSIVDYLEQSKYFDYILFFLLIILRKSKYFFDYIFSTVVDY